LVNDRESGSKRITNGFEKIREGVKIVAMNSIVFALVRRNAFPEVLVDRDG
jgi:hypothetical protein